MLNISFYDGIRYHRMDFINRDLDFFGNGVVALADFPYTLPGGLSISIGSGRAWVDGYRVFNDTNAITLTVSAADPTNPRIDIVQIGHDDINGVGSLIIKKGVAAASPVEPGADPNYLKLFAISVPANATSISAGNITDRRNLVPLNVSGTQINLGGAAGTGQANTFTYTQTFSDAQAPINIPGLTSLPPVGPANTICIVNNMWYTSNGTQWIQMSSAPPPNASTSQAGLVQLTDSTSSTSTTTAATPNSVNQVYTLANGKYSKPGGGIPATDLASGVLPGAATTSQAGTVKIGQGVNVQADGTISVNVFNHLSYWIQ